MFISKDAAHSCLQGDWPTNTHCRLFLVPEYFRGFCLGGIGWWVYVLFAHSLCEVEEDQMREEDYKKSIFAE